MTRFVVVKDFIDQSHVLLFFVTVKQIFCDYVWYRNERSDYVCKPGGGQRYHNIPIATQYSK